MKYAIVNIVWAKSHGIEVLPEMRTSVDQSKVILHEEYLVPFDDEDFPRYSFSDPSFVELLNSEEWTYPEGEQPVINKQFSRLLALDDLDLEANSEINTYNLTPDEEHAGTKDDPIPYAPPMEIFKDKYYTQSKVLYKCIRDSGQPLSHNLSDLVGNYVEKA